MAHEFGQSWSIASALLEGPLAVEGIREHYRLMARRVGIFTDMFSLRDDRGHGPEQHLDQSLEELLRKGWVEREGDLYRLTDTGRRQALAVVEEMKKGKEFLDRASSPKRVSAVTLVVHFALAALKLPAALLSGSVGLLNDALDTLMDGVSSVLVYLGFRLNRERLASFVLVVFMLATGGYTLFEAVMRIVHPVETTSDVFAFVAALASGLVCGLLWLYQKFSGLRHGSMALIAQSVDSRNHVLVALGVTAALISNLLAFPLLDRIVGLAIAVLILKSGAELLKELITSGGDAEESLSHFGFPGFQRFRKRQFQRWLAHLISTGQASDRRELIEKARSAMDFEKVHTFKGLGVHEPRWVEALIREGTEELFNRGYAAEVAGPDQGRAEQAPAGRPLRLTAKGEKLLGGLSFFETAAVQGGRNTVVAAVFAVLRAFRRTVVFAALYVGLRWVLRHLPDFDVWSGGRTLLEVSGFDLSAHELPFVAAGWLLYVTAGLVVRGATRRLHHVRTGPRRRPTKLLTDGIFALTRHPMYSCFILTYAGLGAALHSLWGAIAAVFLGGTAAAETFFEERRLTEQFGDAYRRYRRDVRTRLLPWYGWAAALPPLAAIVVGFVLRTA